MTSLRRAALLCTIAFVTTAMWTKPAHAQEADPASTDTPPEWVMFGFGQIFARYATYQRDDEAMFQAFELQRAELGLGFLHRRRHGMVVNVEGIRSAGSRSTFGIDENSMVLRVKHAFATSSPALRFGELTMRAGLIPDVWVEVVEQAYDLRGISALGSERSGLYASSDLGASLSYALWDERLELRASLMNGEGRNQVELNPGKNTTVILTGRQPLFAWRGHRARLAAHISWRDGSQGFSSLASHRLAGALTLEHPTLFAGVEAVRAQGHSGSGALTGGHLGIWANVAPVVDWAGLYVKAQVFRPNLDADAQRRILQAGLYADLIAPNAAPRNILGFPRLRSYLGYEGLLDDPDAAPVAGVASATNQHALMLTLSARANAELLTQPMTPSASHESDTP